MNAANIHISEPSSLEEAVVTIRRIAEKIHDDIVLRGNRLTPPPFSDMSLLEQLDMWNGLLDEVDSELPEDMRVKAHNILKYMAKFRPLYPYMETIMNFLEYRYIKQYVSIWS